MDKKPSFYFFVSDEIPHEIHPLMAAFMSYLTRTHVHTKSDCVKRVDSVIWKLLCFFYPEYDYELHRKSFKRELSKSERIRKLIEKVTKFDGTLMSQTEQLTFFCDIARLNGQEIACYLFNEKTKGPIWKSNGNRFALIKVPVIHFVNGKYASVSARIQNICGFNMKKEQEETQKELDLINQILSLQN